MWWVKERESMCVRRAPAPCARAWPNIEHIPSPRYERIVSTHLLASLFHALLGNARAHRVWCASREEEQEVNKHWQFHIIQNRAKNNATLKTKSKYLLHHLWIAF